MCFQDSCVRQATRCVRWAKLVTLQQHFLNQGSELRLINLQPAELPAALAALPRCFQVGRPLARHICHNASLKAAYH